MLHIVTRSTSLALGDGSATSLQINDASGTARAIVGFGRDSPAQGSEQRRGFSGALQRSGLPLNRVLRKYYKAMK